MQGKNKMEFPVNSPSDKLIFITGYSQGYLDAIKTLKEYLDLFWNKVSDRSYEVDGIIKKCKEENNVY